MKKYIELELANKVSCMLKVDDITGIVLDKGTNSIKIIFGGEHDINWVHNDVCTLEKNYNLLKKLIKKANRLFC